MNNRGVALGTATLVMIFAVLCLSLFASLTFMSARSELMLARKNAESAAAYYDADTAAAAYARAVVNAADRVGTALSLGAYELEGEYARDFRVDGSRTLRVILDESCSSITGWLLFGVDPTEPPALGLLAEP